ncbi:hypothetical protein [Leifsonia aquatica]|uniref:hypothetical protein n=1 Tax=Leifsonia aquatica TaxID=144185 RepID=UPI000469FF24|nr:hypothetical protein [Leifsonia aquatica]
MQDFRWPRQTRPSTKGISISATLQIVDDSHQLCHPTITTEGPYFGYSEQTDFSNGSVVDLIPCPACDDHHDIEQQPRTGSYLCEVFGRIL